MINIFSLSKQPAIIYYQSASIHHPLKTSSSYFVINVKKRYSPQYHPRFPMKKLSQLPVCEDWGELLMRKYHSSRMQAYSLLNSMLQSQNASYEQFETAIKTFSISQQTYLNLFLVTTVTHLSNHPQFHKFVDLLVNFKTHTAKKSANINYIGYKDRKSILMHACLRGTPRSVETLLEYPIEGEVKDPNGKTAAFYAIRNPNEEHSNSILTLLLTRYPNLVFMEAVNGTTLLHEAVQLLRYSTVELLLRRGANINSKSKQNGNTPAHQLITYYQNNKEVVNSIILLFAKFKANFQQPNNEGITVSDKAKAQGINFEDYVSFCTLLEKDESVIQSSDYDFDKISFTTFNQQTKIGDTASQICEFDSNPFSGQVDFSCLDEQLQILDQKQNDGEVSSEQEQGQGSVGILVQQMFQALSIEIVEFADKQEKKHGQMLPVAQAFFKFLDKIAQKHGLALELVGSFATGLWSNLSDIDISLIPRSTDYINFEGTLQKIYKSFKSKRSELGYEDIYLIRGKINTIKIKMGQKFSFLQFDISIFHRNHQNKYYVTYIIESLSAFPCIKPLFFIFRKICYYFGLHDPLSGGLKTYALFLMIGSVVKSMPTKGIGQLFYQIALYYGFYFEYGFDWCNDQSEKLQDILSEPEMKFNLIDPFNSKNNVGGKNLKTKQMQNMFRVIYYWMSQPGTGPYIPQLFQLNQLF